MILDYSYILKILPHRYPFLLVDYVEVINNKESFPLIRGVKNITFNENFFQGHFINDPVMPGVLLIESAAQSALVGYIYWQLSQKYSPIEILDQNINLNVRFGSIDKVKFRKEVRPGMILHIWIEIIQHRSNFAKFKAVIKDTFPDVVSNIIAEMEMGAWLLNN